MPSITMELSALLITAVAGADPNLLALVDKRRHLHHETGLHFGGFGDVRYGSALESGFSLDNHEIDARRQLDAHGFALVELHIDLELRDQVFHGVAQDVARQVHLL